MISKQTWQEIIDAVANPKLYLKGPSRRKLRAAVELAVEQVCNYLIGSKVRSPEQMALGLNRWIKVNAQHQYVRLAAAVVGVIGDYGILQSGGSEEDGDYQEFIEGPLMEMINLIAV